MYRDAAAARASLELSAIAGGFADTPKSPPNLPDREIASVESPERTLDGQRAPFAMLMFLRDAVEKKKRRKRERKRRNLVYCFCFVQGFAETFAKVRFKRWHAPSVLFHQSDCSETAAMAAHYNCKTLFSYN